MTLAVLAYVAQYSAAADTDGLNISVLGDSLKFVFVGTPSIDDVIKTETFCKIYA